MTSPRRVAVVTGAAQGIGRRTAEVLAGEGFAVLVTDLRSPDETVDAITSAGGEALPVLADITDPEAVRRLAAEAARHLGDVEVLVNNAGVALIAPAETTTDDEWRRILEINLTSPFLLCREFGAVMLRVGRGSIVNVASIAGLRGVADRAAYNASKHGLIGLTRTLAAEWGGRGVRVNAVCPGWVKTEMDVAAQDAGLYRDEDITDEVPMARFASAGDIASAIAFLANPERSGFVNGVALPVDGGWIADAGWTALRRSKR